MNYRRNDPVVMYDSPEAASLQTVTGWVSRTGRYWGNDEQMARYDGSTHRKCEANPEHPVYETNSYCTACHHARRAAKFREMPRAPWDGTTPLVVFDTDQYLWDAEAVHAYLKDNDIAPEDAQLVICKPNKLSQIDADHWSDDLPEDGELPDAVGIALDALNRAIQQAPVASWTEGNTAVELPADYLTATKDPQ